MSRLGMKEVIARAIVDKDFRSKAFGPGGDLDGSVQRAGYDVNKSELEMLRCNNEDSFDERFVTIENMMDYWKRSEERIVSLTSGVAAGSAPDPQSPAG